jgi:anti-sigma B factor antagonist
MESLGDESRFEVAVERSDGHCVVVFRGELDMNATDDLWQCIDGVRTNGQPVILDMSGTTFMDSAGITLLLRTYVAQGRTADAVTLRAPSDAVKHTLAVSGIGEMFHIDDTTP